MWEHKGLALATPGLPETERICKRVVSLPMSAETTPEQVGIIAECTRQIINVRSGVAQAQGV
jgi:dTDP-4-amino-4,6-dideoxygalactose transaminase